MPDVPIVAPTVPASPARTPPPAPAPPDPVPASLGFLERLKSAKSKTQQSPTSPTGPTSPTTTAPAVTPPPVQAAPAATTPAATPPPAASAPPTPEPPKKPVTKKPAAKPTAPAIDIEGISDRVAEGVARGLKTAVPPAASAPETASLTPEQLEASLSEDYSGGAEVFLEMAKTPKYADLPKRLVEFSKKEQDYIAQWQEKHPDDEFDAEATEHNSFYSRHEPKFAEKDFRAAERNITVRMAEEAAERKYRPMLEGIEKEKKAAALEPLAAQAYGSALENIIKAINPEYAKALSNNEEFAKIVENDPGVDRAAMSVLKGWTDSSGKTTPGLYPVINTVLHIYAGVEQFDRDNPVHKEVQRIADGLEGQLLAMEADRTVWNGKRFIDRTSHARMEPERAARYWSIGQAEIINHAIGEYSSQAAERYKREEEIFNAWAKKKGLTKAEAVAAASNGAPEGTLTSQTSPAALTSPTTIPGGGPAVTGRVSIGTDTSQSGPTLATGLNLLRARLRSK